MMHFGKNVVQVLPPQWVAAFNQMAEEALSQALFDDNRIGIIAAMEVFFDTESELAMRMYLVRGTDLGQFHRTQDRRNQ